MSGKQEKAWSKIPSLGLEMDVDYTDRIKAKEGRRHNRSDIYNLKKVVCDDASSFPIRVATAAQGVFTCLILDISESGCQIAVPKQLKKGELAKVSFVINRRSVISRAVVKWISRKDDCCCAGLEFKEISPELKKFLGTVSSASLFHEIGRVN